MIRTQTGAMLLRPGKANHHLSVMNVLSILWRRLWSWSSPAVSGCDDAEVLAARTLQPLLIGVILWGVMFLALGIPFFAVRKLAGVILCILLLLLSLAAILLLRKGRISQAGWLFLSGTWIFAIVLNVLTGGFSSNCLLMYLSLIVTAAWLLGHKAALLCGSVFLCQTLIMAVMARIGIHFPKYFPAPPISSWLVLTLFIAIAILPLNQVLQTLKGALMLARQRVVDLEKTEQALRESEERLRTIIEMAPDGVFFTDASGRFIEVNEAACRQLGYTREQLLQRSVLDIVSRERSELAGERIRTPKTSGAYYESCHIRSDGTEVPVELGVAKIMFRGQPLTVGVARDITDRKRAEAERARLEEQYRQAQKMESVGRLAGGIAHDFNNLLTVINGYSDLMLGGLRSGDPVREYADQIRQAGGRAASLTQQLLAFSRKQVILPKPLDLNLIIAEAEKMLRRLVGEDIVVKTVLNPSLGVVMADPGQMHQVLMNLAVNARDAMPNGGELIIETANVELGEQDVADSLGVKSGSYVMMAITDNGVGMDEETHRHMFEPFFTTKGKGEGTGLGLSMVYGIVRQSEGWIKVDSEPGKGTTFKIYLSRIDACKLADDVDKSKTLDLRGSETILVVEDQEEVRKLAANVLRSYGYHVLAAAGGADAMLLAARHPGDIHLMITDVVMPGMTGRELADKQKPLRPQMKVLYTSGYTDNVIAHRGVLEPGLFYLSKPYTPQTLAEKVREVLGLFFPP